MRDVITRHFIIATAGHVDHGKSTLVKVLTGTDPDRLPEEKARGITIDLGFAELNLTASDGENIHAGIVDVPGHEDFVRNMIAGVGSVDLALFVVAADDGWMPQSEEHLQILNYLGVKRAVVAITKSDLGKIDIEQVRNRLMDTAFERAPVISTSFRTGDGIQELKSALATELSAMKPQRDYGKPRLFVDRVFTLHGIGTVVTGTLTGGQLSRGRKIVIQPNNLETRIRSIQSHGRELEAAQPGMRTAINLPDVSVDQINRGDVITIVDLGEPSSKLIVQLQKSARLHLAQAPKNGSSVYLHHGTSRVAARIASLAKDGISQLKLATPIFAFLGDRFVLRDPSERHTIGGGVILNPDGARNRKFETAAEDVDLCARSEIASSGFVRKEALLRKSHFSSEEIADALGRLERKKETIVRGEIAANSDAWKKLRAEAISLIDRAHERNPERLGLDLSELRTALIEHAPEVFDALIIDLAANGFVRAGSAIARRTHRSSLPAELQSIANKIRELLLEKPFDPPARRELEQDRQAREVLRFMIQTGELVEVDADVILLRENCEQMKDSVAGFISRNGPATVSELRQAVNSSRRVMVPFLERLDRDGITRRAGDKRSLR